MATYKKACAKCGALIPGDAQVCPFCENADPFVSRCPRCRQPVEPGWKVCSSCGLKLIAVCSKCGNAVPAAPKCAACGAPLLVTCPNKRCNHMQLLTKENKCEQCGKPLVK